MQPTLSQKVRPPLRSPKIPPPDICADQQEQALYGLKSEKVYGVQQFRQRVPYETFKSQYGPK